MKFGLLVPMFGQLCDPVLLRDFAQQSEDLGFESLWVGDHIVLPRQSTSTYQYLKSKEYRTDRGEQARPDRWDSLAALTFISAVTHRVVLGTSVFIAPYRHPLVSAKAFASLDVMSAGRLEVGVGAGWLKEEFDALAVPFDQRGGVMDETLDVWQQAWSGANIQHAGRHFQINDVAMHPTPVRGGIPLAFGGHSRPTLRRIIERRGGWHVVTESPEHCYGWSDSLPTALDQLRRAWDDSVGDGNSAPVTGVIIDGPAADGPALASMSIRYDELGVERLVLDFPAVRAANGPELMASIAELARILPIEQS